MVIDNRLGLDGYIWYHGYRSNLMFIYERHQMGNWMVSSLGMYKVLYRITGDDETASSYIFIEMDLL